MIQKQITQVNNFKDFKQNTKSGYHKLDIVVDTKGKKHILDYSFLLKNRNDSFVAKKLLKKVKFTRCKILGDKGYVDYQFRETVKDKQNNFISPPKDYKGKCRHNNFKRRRKEENFQANKQIYRRRPIVESVFSSLKRVQDLRLKSRLLYMKKREMGWHILLYNIRMNVKFEANPSGFGQAQIDYFFVLIEIFSYSGQRRATNTFINYSFDRIIYN